MIGAVGASVWLGLFAFKHVEYSRDLWWQFELQGDASRFLRASVGAAVVLLLFGFARLIGYAPHEAPAPTQADLQDAEKAIAAQTSTFPNLAFLKDKALLFDDTRSAFVMYAVQGRTWAALGDPVGPEERLTDLVRLFLERCADFGGIPVFYEVTSAHLHRYADFGLTFVKLGEEAKVDLTTFTLEGGHGREIPPGAPAAGKGGRRVPNRRARPVCRRYLSALRAVSDDWLAAKAGGEKGFSLGFFDEEYLSRFPIAVIEREGQIQAFANLWPGPQRVELSVDLMRYHRAAPKGVMEALFVHLMQWGKQQGYHWFVLGMAPVVRVRAITGRLALESHWRVRLRARRVGLQLSGAARLQGEVQSGVGTALPRVPGRTALAAHAGRCVCARRRRVPHDSPQAMRIGGGMSSNRRVLAESVAAAFCGYVVAAIVEGAFIRAVRPSEWELAWLSDVVLAVAFGVAVYLWRHLLTTRHDLAERERAELVLQTQLSLAADIQQRLLPTVPPANDGFELAASLRSAGEIGGDFYDFVETAPGVWLILVADVSGKGIPAAMALGSLRLAFRAFARRGGDPADVGDAAVRDHLPAVARLAVRLVHCLQVRSERGHTDLHQRRSSAGNSRGADGHPLSDTRRSARRSPAGRTVRRRARARAAGRCVPAGQ